MVWEYTLTSFAAANDPMTSTDSYFVGLAGSITLLSRLQLTKFTFPFQHHYTFEGKARRLRGLLRRERTIAERRCIAAENCAV